MCYIDNSNGRVLLAAGGSSRGGRPDHRSVIIDRARPMLPASSVPEDLIAQAQVHSSLSYSNVLMSQCLDKTTRITFLSLENESEPNK